MKPVIGFIGHHNSGKTTLIRKVLKELDSRGHRVAVIKSTKHDIKDLDTHGTDTYLYSNDGTESVALVTPNRMYLFQNNTNEPLKRLAERLFPHAGLVVAEGFKHAPDIPKIEVVRTDISEGPLRDKIKGVKAVVSDRPIEGETVFNFSQISELADFIEKILDL